MSRLRTVAGALHRRRTHRRPLEDRPISLASLRARIDPESDDTSWAVHPDGALGRALIAGTGAVVTFPLQLGGVVWLTARAMLLPHDWRDRRGTVRAWVAVIDAHGRQRELWAADLEASDHGRPRGHSVAVEIPADSTALTLGVTPVHAAGAFPLRRAIFLEPTIIDPNAPAIQPAPPPTDRTAAAPPPADCPPISVLIPVHDPALHMLEEAIASVTAQTYPHWELCLVDDGSQNPEIIAALQRHAVTDPRIKLTRHEQAQGISAATNSALAMATGTYIALLDHDDTLTPDALQHVADTIAAQPDLDMIYSDEAVIADGVPPQRHIKPAWSPEHMATLMYTCHLGVYRRELAQQLGGFASRFDGCQDYDFVLRLTERTDRIAHLPRILYHWRAHATSTAGGDAKPYAYLAQPGAISEHLDRQSVDAEVRFGQLPGMHRIVHAVSPTTNVDLIVPVAGSDGLGEAAASWQAQPHDAWTVVLAGPQEAIEAAAAGLADAGLPAGRLRAVPVPASDAGATALATAAASSMAEHLVLMQSPAMGLTHDWLTRLLGYCSQPGIAAAGAVLLAPDGRIQQAGIAMPDGIPLHLHHGSPAALAPPVVSNLSAVSGIIATRRATFHDLGGLDPRFGELCLIEYCLRARRADQRIVLVPDARLRTTGLDPTTNDLPTMWKLQTAWARHNTRDSYYNPSYRTDRGDFIRQHFQ